MKETKHSYFKTAYIILTVLLLIGVGYIIANRFLDLPIHIQESRLVLVLAFLAELLILLFTLQKFLKFSPQERRENIAKHPVRIWKLIFYFCLPNLLLLTVLSLYFFSPTRNEYAAAQLALKVLIPGVFLVGIGTGLSFLQTFHQDFSFEERSENKRFTYIFLGICFVLGLVLRLINLDKFPAYVDENLHTHSAMLLLKGQLSSYQRAFSIVTIPVYLSFKIFGVNLWAGRFPMVLFNMLAIFPLFSFTKKINKTVGYLAVFLFVTSPWIIAVSRTIREYAVMPFFAYLIALFLYDLLDWEGLTVLQFLKKNALRLFFLILFFAYGLYDGKSVFMINMVIYAIFFVVMTLKFLKKGANKWLKVGAIVLIITAFVVILDQSGLARRVLKTGQVINYTNVYWLSLTTNTHLQHWYYLGFFGYVILVFSLMLLVWILIKKYSKSNLMVFFSQLLFIAYLVYFTFINISLTRSVRMRYGILTEYWYLVLAAAFLYAVYTIIRKKISSKIVRSLLSIGLIFGLFVNYAGLQETLTYRGGRNFTITDESHYRVQQAYEILSRKLTENDILLADVVTSYAELIQQPLRTMQTVSWYRFFGKSEEKPREYIESYPQGWIAVTINARPDLYDIPYDNFNHADKQVEYLGEFGDVHIWSWGQ